MGSNCLLCISGNFDKKEVLPLIEQNFNSKLDRIKINSKLFRSNIKSNNNIQLISTLKPNITKYIHVEKDINQTIINFVFNIYDTYNDNNIAIDIICDILSNGFSSRLFNLLRNKMGVSYFNNSSSRNFNDIGNLIISVGVDHKSVLDTITNIIKELKDIKTNGINQIELSKAKKQNETRLLYQFKDPYEYLMYFGMNYLIKKPLYNISDILQQIDDVKLSNINILCNKIFTADNIIIGTIGKLNTNIDKQIIKIINSL
jgi:predicted Zn-dependent peptidase